MSSPRQLRRAAAPHLAIRATTTKPKLAQPTGVIALSTTFTPPSSCFENRLSMLPPKSFIWANEPVPVQNQTYAACYPKEFLSGYTSVNVTTPSSIVPAMSPFVCPKGYCTRFAGPKNYIACCPSGYQFHDAETTVDTDRPAYGGTCYSDIPFKTDVPVLKFDEEGKTSTGIFSTSASGAQAFAHPIDGWALTSPTVGCPTPESSTSDFSGAGSESSSSNPSSSNAASPVASFAPSTNSISTGAIVGATIGACAALVALIALVWFLLKRRRGNNANGIPKGAHQMDDDAGGPKAAYYPHYEAPGSFDHVEAPAGYDSHEVSGAYPVEKSQAQVTASQMNDGHGAFEMDAVSVTELPAQEAGGGKGKSDGKIVALSET